jgi:hypothetical protein
LLQGKHSQLQLSLLLLQLLLQLLLSLLLLPLLLLLLRQLFFSPLLLLQLRQLFLILPQFLFPALLLQLLLLLLPLFQFLTQLLLLLFKTFQKISIPLQQVSIPLATQHRQAHVCVHVGLLQHEIFRSQGVFCSDGDSDD